MQSWKILAQRTDRFHNGYNWDGTELGVFWGKFATGSPDLGGNVAGGHAGVTFVRGSDVIRDRNA